MIRITTGGATSATASQITYEIIEKLCRPYCTNNALQPIVTKTWSIASTETINAITYVTFQCVINVTYQPKGSTCPCSQKTNTYIETFVVSFPQAGTATFVDSNGFTEPSYICSSNCNSAQGIKNYGNLAITFSPAG